MNDPVFIPSGYTVGKSFIMKWIDKNPTDPFTRGSINKSQLAVNRLLKDEIDSLPKDIYDELNEKKIKRKKVTRNIDDIKFRLTEKLDELSISSIVDEKYLHLIIDSLVEVENNYSIVFAIDISGSTSDEAVGKSKDGTTEHNGISVLDLIRQAAKLIVEFLGDEDYLSIIAFNHEATIVCEPKKMNKENKNIVNDLLDKLRSGGGTNIYDGIMKSFELMNGYDNSYYIKRVFLLTDGVANNKPPKGHERALIDYKCRYGCKCPIDTFGFGPNMDSSDLSCISNITDGDMNYISDPSMMCDIFSNKIGNLKNTFLNNFDILLTKDGQKFRLNTKKFGPIVEGVTKVISINLDDETIVDSRISLRSVINVDTFDDIKIELVHETDDRIHTVNVMNDIDCVMSIQVFFEH